MYSTWRYKRDFYNLCPNVFCVGECMLLNTENTWNAWKSSYSAPPTHFHLHFIAQRETELCTIELFKGMVNSTAVHLWQIMVISILHFFSRTITMWTVSGHRHTLRHLVSKQKHSCYFMQICRNGFWEILHSDQHKHTRSTQVVRLSECLPLSLASTDMMLLWLWGHSFAVKKPDLHCV